MKVKITRLKTSRQKFQPYKVTFWVRNPKEGERFHDDVAIKVCRTSHDFIGTVYQLNHNEVRPGFEGQI